MFCSNCGYECDSQDRFCSHCGTPLTSENREKKGRHWVPLAIMTLIFAFGLFLFFALPGSGSSAPAVDEALVDNSWFYVDNGVLYFEESRYSGNTELTVPSELFGQTVTSIGEGCFENCTGLTSVILPSTLQAIGEDAFRGCTALRGIEIPESVKLIGENAFSGCTALEAVCVYDGLASVGAGTFSGCTKLFYIYYSGNFEDWNALYNEFVNPYTTVFALNGTFYQGEAPN